MPHEPYPLPSAYDAFAWFYDRHWAAVFAEKALWAVETLLLPYIPIRGRVLDVCCGTGQLAAELCRRAYRSTGLDSSGEMLAHARARIPGASLVRADARAFSLRPVHDAAVSMFDSLNHVLDSEDLIRVFRNVRGALRDDAWFLFDLNSEAGFRERWVYQTGMTTVDGECTLSGVYDSEERLGRYRVTLSGRGREAWRAADFELVERCHTEAEVRRALAVAGFGDVETHDAEKSLEISDEVGRVFYLARACSPRSR
jgi:SAM-dependent methyltransferase